MMSRRLPCSPRCTTLRRGGIPTRCWRGNSNWERQAMPQFLVTLYDGTDAEAPARRAASRPVHLDGLKDNVASGKLVFGGPIFDEAQKPIGSFLLADCKDRAELDAII